MIYRILLSLSLVLLLSCTSDKPQAPASSGEQSAASSPEAASPGRPENNVNSASRSLAILPEKVYAGSTLSLRATGFTLPSQGSGGRVVWKINGSPVSSADPMRLDLSEHLVSKGDSVEAVAELDGESIGTGPVAISNHLPVITSHAFFDAGEATGKLSMEVRAEDPDGDPVTIEYLWTVNGLPAGTGKSPDVSLSPDDEIEVAIKAYDGEEYSDEITEKFTLVSRPPRFERIEKYYMEGSTYIYNSSAVDPEGDAITFSLVNAPPGMTVNPESGQVRWDVPADFLGTIEYTIVATDTNGLNAVQQMKFGMLKE